MRSDVGKARMSDETADLTGRAIGTTFDFIRAAAADPEVLDKVPDGATLVLIPDDDAELSAAEVEHGIAAVRWGDNVYFRHIRRRESPSERTWDEANELDRRYGAVWAKLKSGELTPAEAWEQSRALLEHASSEAVRMATRRWRVRATTLWEQGGRFPSPALAGIRALLDEVGHALDSGALAAIDVDDYKRRLAAYVDDFRREVEGT